MCEYLFFYAVGDNKNILGFMEGGISKIIFFLRAFLEQSFLPDKFQFLHISKCFWSFVS